MVFLNHIIVQSKERNPLINSIDKYNFFYELMGMFYADIASLTMLGPHVHIILYNFCHNLVNSPHKEL